MPDPAFDETPPVELIDDIPVVRLAATQKVFDEAIDVVASVVRRIADEGRPHLLIDARQASFGAPSLVDRLCMVRLWARAAGGRVRIAMVVPPEFIDPERFGVVAAGKFGLASQVFEGEAEAIAWLHEEHAAELRRRH